MLRTSSYSTNEVDKLDQGFKTWKVGYKTSEAGHGDQLTAF